MADIEMSIVEARARFADIIDRVRLNGETTYITRYGRRVAAIVPLEAIMTTTTTIDITELTRRLGLPDHEQSTVLAWTGDEHGHRWTEAEAAELAEAWHADHTGDETTPITDIPAALSGAGIDTDTITTTPDGVTTVTRADGARISIGWDGDGYSWTRYVGDTDVESGGSDDTADLPETIAMIARWAKG